MTRERDNNRTLIRTQKKYNDMIKLNGTQDLFMNRNIEDYLWIFNTPLIIPYIRTHFISLKLSHQMISSPSDFLLLLIWLAFFVRSKIGYLKYRSSFFFFFIWNCHESTTILSGSSLSIAVCMCVLTSLKKHNSDVKIWIFFIVIYVTHS